ncbi:hypothetical protein LguiB_010821 [Lonicera macranthoides]
MKAASKQSNFKLLSSLKPQPNFSLLRHISTETNPPQPSQENPSFITQVSTLLQSNNPDDWPTNPTLHQLLSSQTLTPLSLLKITRQLPTTTKALKFFDYLRNISPSPLTPQSLSSTFQAILEIASHEEPDSVAKISDIYAMSNELHVTLSPNSTTLLIRFFGRVGMVEKAVDVYNNLDPDGRNTHVRNVAIDVLLRSGRVEDALKLLDEMLEPDGVRKPNGNTADIVFGALLKRNWSGRSVGEEEIVGLVLKFCKLGVIPSAVWLSQLITKLCRCGNSDHAWNLLHDLIKLGGNVDTSLWNALLTGLGREGDFDRMNVLLKEMKETNIQPNVVTFGILINHLCKSRRIDNALEVFKNVTSGDNGICAEPDVMLYNTMIDGLCKVGRQEEGLALMEKMKLQHSCNPNTVTYNCLIDGFCKAGEIERSHELFDEMNKLGVTPNVITLNSLVDGMCKHGRVNSAMELVNEMQVKNLKANSVTYTVLIRAFCNANNIGKAMRLFDEMLNTGISADAIVYYTLISGLCQAGKLDDASFVVSMMEKAGYRLDIVSYNILIGGFCRKKRLDKAYALLKDMEQAGVRPDSVTYNTLISYFSVTGDFTTAHRVMKRMVNDGFVPNVVTYGALIHAYCLVGNLDEAMKIFGEMSGGSRVQPNAVLYNILIDSMCKNDKVESALSLMDDMKAKEVRPNTTTYNAIFKGLQDRNMLDKALKLMDQMTEQAVNPDYVTMEILTEWLSVVGEIEKLKSFVQGYEVSASTA